MADKNVMCECGAGPFVRISHFHLGSARHRAWAAVEEVVTTPALGGEPDAPRSGLGMGPGGEPGVQAANWPLSDQGTTVRTRRAGAMDIIVDRDPKQGGPYVVHVDHDGVEFDDVVAEHLLLVRPEELVRV